MKKNIKNYVLPQQRKKNKQTVDNILSVYRDYGIFYGMMILESEDKILQEQCRNYEKRQFKKECSEAVKQALKMQEQ